MLSKEDLQNINELILCSEHRIKNELRNDLKNELKPLIIDIAQIKKDLERIKRRLGLLIIEIGEIRGGLNGTIRTFSEDIMYIKSYLGINR